MSKTYSKLKAAGLTSEHTPSWAELTEPKEKKTLISFCNAACAGSFYESVYGYPVKIGLIKHCPRCGARIVYAGKFTASQLCYYKKKFSGLS